LQAKTPPRSGNLEFSLHERSRQSLAFPFTVAVEGQAVDDVDRARHHIAHDTVTHRGQDLVGPALTDHEADEALGQAVPQRPCHRRDMVRTRYGAQMHFHFLELDPVAEDFYLIVEAAEVMEHAALVLHPEVARQVPPLAVDRRKARSGEFLLLEVTDGELQT